MLDDWKNHCTSKGCLWNPSFFLFFLFFTILHSRSMTVANIACMWLHWVLVAACRIFHLSGGESQGRGSLVGCRLWGRTESDTTEAT